MSDHEAGIDHAIKNHLKEWLRVSLDVRLPSSNGNGLVHRGAQRDFVRESNVDFQDGKCTPFSTTFECLSNHVWAVAIQMNSLFHTVVRTSEATGVRFASDCIDASIRSATVRHFHQFVVKVRFLVVDDFSISRFGQLQAFHKTVYRDHAAGPQNPC